MPKKDVVMPALEMAQDRGTLIRWLKEEGDFVKKGEPLMEIETDKADVEIEAPASGVLSDISAQAGDEVPVGKVIASIVPDSDSAKEGAASAQERSRKPKDQPAAPPVAPHSASATPNRPAAAAPASGAPLASPKARRLAAEARVDLSNPAGSGAQGVVRASDVLGQKGASPEESEQPEYKTVPVEGIRRVIAERLQAIHSKAPHISLTLSVDMGPARTFVNGLKERRDSNGTKSPGMTALIFKAAALAVLECPQLNSHYLEAEVRQFSVVHLGIAVALDDGLVVPVLRNLQNKSLLELQPEIDDLVGRARNGRLKPTELSGSTFTVSNLGMLGVEQFSAILNPPEVGILSVGTIAETPQVMPDSSIAATPTMKVTINADHRSADGAVCARFLTTFRSLLGKPEQL